MGINAEILRQPESRDAAEKRKIAEEIRLLQAKELYPSEFRNIRGPNYVPSAEARRYLLGGGTEGPLTPGDLERERKYDLNRLLERVDCAIATTENTSAARIAKA